MATTEQSGGHLRDYWRIAWHGRWMVLAIAVVVVTLVAVATFMQTEIYRATAILEVQPRPKSISPNADFSQLGAGSWSWGAEERYLNTQAEIVRGRAIAGKVLDDLDLRSNPAFAELRDPVGALANRVDLKILLDTYVMQISIEDADPEMAALLANAVSHAYVDFNAEGALQNAKMVIEGLRKEIDPFEERIEKLEKDRLRVARDKKIYVPETQETALDRRLAQLQAELTTVQIKLGEHQATIEDIDEIERDGGSYLSLSFVADDPLIKSLSAEKVKLEQQLQELSLSYREGHPKFMAVREALAEIPDKIDEQAEKLIVEVKTDYRIADRRAKDLVRQLDTIRSEGFSYSETSGEIATIDAKLKEERRIYELITARMKEIELNADTLTNNVRLLEEAIVPAAPVRPRKVLNLAAGLLLGLVLGFGTVFFVDYLDNTIKNAEDIEQYLGVPLLALVPARRKGGEHQHKEAFQTLRTSILFASKGRSLKTLLVTSAGPGEGKSSTIVELARTLAAAGDRVVLIDGDLRRPTVHGHLRLPRPGGLTNYLVDSNPAASWRSYLKPIPDAPNLEVLTCGPLPPNPAELFGAERFASLLRELRAAFDWVLIDSPPVASVSDSVILGSMTEMTVMVVKHNENDRDLIRTSVEKLRKVDAHLVGAVLNNVDLKKAGYYGYYAGYKYERAGEVDDSITATATRAVGSEKSS
jgi:capsular exopolysaccharide synthesis family protein